MESSLPLAFARNFLGRSPDWYKLTILGFLLLNPIVLWLSGSGVVTGWLVVIEFIFTLAMALKCYPLAPGGLLALEAIILDLTKADHVYEEALHNFPVILLLIFMVAGIFFLKELLLFTFTKIILGIKSKPALSLWFCGVAAVLSAFLDALTVTAVIITVGSGFYSVYHKVASGGLFTDDLDDANDDLVQAENRADLIRFRAFLRQLLMHGAVGTALGGVTTIVGEPQNLLIGKVLGWQFGEFFVRMAPVSLPVLAAGLATCFLLEKARILGYGTTLPESVRSVLTQFDEEQGSARGVREHAVLIAQALVVVVLVCALGLQLAEVGVIGLLVIVLATALTGVIEENRIGHAFEEALPFTALLVVFFAIVAVINDQHLFQPVVEYVLTLEGKAQLGMFFVANGVLSMISDNVFVATVYISSVQDALTAGLIDREQFEQLAIAINTGTNIPSVATPNGQAAFLFLLTSAVAPLIRLSYGRMVLLAFPYTVSMSVVGLLSIIYLL